MYGIFILMFKKQYSFKNSLSYHPRNLKVTLPVIENSTVISKAYDRVDWHYLFSIMRRMSFHQTWINWMKMCVTNVKYHILMNDDRVGPMIPERGLR
jgi:hypothetical protein